MLRFVIFVGKLGHQLEDIGEKCIDFGRIGGFDCLTMIKWPSTVDFPD